MGEFSRRTRWARLTPLALGSLAVLSAALPAGSANLARPATAESEPAQEAPEDPDGSSEEPPPEEYGEDGPEEWEEDPGDWEDEPDQGEPAPEDGSEDEPVDAQPTENSVTLVSDGGWGGGGNGLTREYDDLNARITMSGTDAQVDVEAAGGAHRDSLYLSFAAPEGEVLEAGVYERAQPTSSWGGSRPRLGTSGGGQSCTAVGGRFEVKDLTRSDEGIDSIWLVYEQRCEGGNDSMFGEVRIGQPLGSAAALMAPRAIAWPEIEREASGSVVPVVVRNFSESPLDVGASTLSGDDSAEFAIRADDCAGRTLGPGDGCEVHLRLVSRTGSKPVLTASLDVPNSADPVALSVQLQGRVAPGRTAWTMRSDPGDWVGGGRSYSFTAADSDIAVAGARNGIHTGVRGHDSWFTGTFLPAPGDVIAPGTYQGARRASVRENSPGLDVNGDHRGCNAVSGSFTVHEVAFSPDNGRLDMLRLTFEQHCEGALPALRGEITYRYVAPPSEPGPVPAEPAVPAPNLPARPGDRPPGPDGPLPAVGPKPLPAPTLFDTRPLPSAGTVAVPGPRGGRS